jgi:hypothetical protein
VKVIAAAETAEDIAVDAAKIAAVKILFITILSFVNSCLAVSLHPTFPK